MEYAFFHAVFAFIIANMVVYWEYAFAENFFLDGLLLWLAVACTRENIKWVRLIFASAVGAAFAVTFPLFALPVWAAYLVKALSGVVLALLVSPKGVRACVLTVAAFFALTFLYGGALTAVYSFFKIEYAEGNGYFVEKAPVSLVLTGAAALAICAVLFIKRFYKYGQTKRNLCKCVLGAGEKEVTWQGFCDSGNLLSFRGRPVCVISSVGALALFGALPESAGRITVTTVNGSRSVPVFACDYVKIGGREYRGVYLAAAGVPNKNYQIILHANLSHSMEPEEQHEAHKPVASIFKKKVSK